MSRAARRGVFVLLEGPDRSGKTTQARRLVDSLVRSGRPAVFMNFPDRSTAIGSVINAYLQNQAESSDRVIHLLFSANRWEQEERIRSTLAAGTHVVMDRYSYSGVAFSMAKGLDAEWCMAPERGLPAPDVTLYLELTPEEAARRGDYGKERYEKVEFQKRVSAVFGQLRQSQSRPDSPWITVAAGRSVEEVGADIEAAVEKAISSGGDRPIPLL